MATLITPSKYDFLLQEHPVNMHEETTEWLSDIEFCKTELAFLSKLLDKAYLNAGAKGRINELSDMKMKVNFFSEKTLIELHNSIVKHEHRLASLDKNAFSADANTIKEEHKKKSLNVKAFMNSVKKIKKDVFDFVEVHIKQSKKISKDFEEGNLTL